MNELFDMDLLREYARARDAEAFAEIVRRHAGMVYTVARRVTGNNKDAEDVTQTCFLELARKAGEIKSSVGGWLHRAATFRATDLIRASDRRAEHEKAAGLPSNPKRDSTFQEISDMVDQALEKLPEELRELVVMHFLQGRTQAQIAAELKLDQSTVSRRISKGVADLREIMEKQGLAVGSVEALKAMLIAHGVGEAPPGLVAALCKLALAGVKGSRVGGAIATTSFLGTKALTAGCVAMLIVAAVVGVFQFGGRGPSMTSRPTMTLASNVKHQNGRTWIDGIPSLSWDKDGQTTFCGALAAGLTGTDRPVDYDTLMGVSAIAFRVRWYEGPGSGDRWVGGIPVGEQEEERALVGKAIGVKFDSLWADASQQARHQQAIDRVTASVNAGNTVITYVAPHMDCAVAYGYSEDKKTILAKDYFGGAGPDVYPAGKIGPWFLFMEKNDEALSQREALVAALSAAARNWSRTDRPQLGFPGHFLYGSEAWERWIADMKSAKQLSAKDKQMLLFVNWWNFDCLSEARGCAARYLRTRSNLFSGDGSKRLAQAAMVYEQSAKMLAEGLKQFNIADKPGWAQPDYMAKWTPEVRARQIAVLEQARDLDARGIGELRQALGGDNAMAVRPFEAKDWPVVLELANAALPGHAQDNRDWFEARKKLDEASTPRRHYLLETGAQGKAVAYGAVEVDLQTHRARIFLVAPASELQEVAAGPLMNRLMEDASGLGAKTLWAREWAEDETLVAVFRQFGFQVGPSPVIAGKQKMVLLERSLQTQNSTGKAVR